MADINYSTTVEWDPNVRDVGFCDADDETLAGLAESGIYMVAGAPSNVAGHWIPSATVKNEADGFEYINVGTTASPNFQVVGTTTPGIDELTGDVLAGPGSGSQVATVVGLNGVSLDTLATVVDTNFYVYDSGSKKFEPVSMSQDALMDNAGIVTVQGLKGVPINTPATVDSTFYIFDTFSGGFTPVAMSGDATMNAAGAVTVTGSLGDFAVGGALFGSVGVNLSAPSVLPVIKDQIEITTAGTGDAFSLPDGGPGQYLTLLYVAEGSGTDTAIVTPTNLAGGTIITFNAVGDTALLKFGTGGWYFIAGSAILS